MSFTEKDYLKISEKFKTHFEKNWDKLIDTLYFRQQQFSSGNRLRPYIVLAGYCSTKTDFCINDEELNKISMLSATIELIHKSSLILDDLIDQDPERHGKMAFHEEYGTEKTIMFAINLLSVSIENLNQFIENNPDFPVLKQKGLKLITKTMYDMSLGELKELQLDKTTRYNMDIIKEIIHLETSPLIANSLVLGYYAGNGTHSKVENTLSEIGYDCGYIFQVMNDMEPFCNPDKLIDHKGRLNMDINTAKKNIVQALLYGLLSQKEKDALSLPGISSDEQYHLLVKYFKYYDIKSTFIRDLDFIHCNIHNQIDALASFGIQEDWRRFFKTFVDNIISECNQRIS